MSPMLGLVGDRGLAWGPRDPSVGCSLFLKGHWWWEQPEDCCGLSSRPGCHLCAVCAAWCGVSVCLCTPVSVWAGGGHWSAEPTSHEITD